MSIDDEAQRCLRPLPDVAPRPRLPAHRSWPYLLRIAVLLVSTLIAYGGVLDQTVISVLSGSRLVYLAVLPVLVAMIAIGDRAEAHGVNDAEADWLLAAVVCGVGLMLLYLVDIRLPTLAALWQIHLVGAIIWIALVAVILFGVRRVAVKWPMWLFALTTVTMTPYLLSTDWLGGSNVRASAACAAIGAVAVFLAGRRRRLRWRLVAGGASAAAGISAAVALSSQPLLVSVVVSAGLVPVLAFTLLAAITKAQPSATTRERTPLPRRSPRSLTVLAVIAVVPPLLTGASISAGVAPAQANADWTTRANLVPAQHFDFIHRYLGPDATFVRYTVAPRRGFPQAAVDVITDANCAALASVTNVIWYPFDVMPQYVPIDLGDPAITGAREAITDSTVQSDATADNWVAITWAWHTSSGYQQVFVVVNEDLMSSALPPPPEPLSLHDAAVAPILWLARGQANPSNTIDPQTAARAQQLVSRIASAGA